MTSIAMANARTTGPQLTEVLFGSNHTPESRWSQGTGAVADIAACGFHQAGNWSVSCNLDHIDVGTTAFFSRSGDGGLPALAGFIVCTGAPEEYEIEDGAGNPVLGDDGDVVTEWYVDGRLHGWDSRLWVPGSEIQAAGWPVSRAPWGTKAVRQFRNGERLTPDLLQIIVSAIPESLVRTVALEVREVTGSFPWWA